MATLSSQRLSNPRSLFSFPAIEGGDPAWEIMIMHSLTMNTSRRTLYRLITFSIATVFFVSSSAAENTASPSGRPDKGNRAERDRQPQGCPEGERPAGSINASSTKPNILLMMCDDMGWRDLSCFQNDRMPTPHVDCLALEGMKLTQFYAASAVCTPTRASVLTGKYPLRFDIRAHFNSGKGEYLPVSTTIPKRLQESGYSTVHIGKWHLGGLRVRDFAMRDRSPGPIQHGFQHYLTQREEQPLRGNMLRKRNLYREGGTCLLQDDQQVG